MAWTERNDGLIWKWWLAGTLTDADVGGVFQFIGAKDAGTAVRNWLSATEAEEVDAAIWTRAAGFQFDGVANAYDSKVLLAANCTVLILLTNSEDGRNDRVFGLIDGGNRTFRIRIDKDPSLLSFSAVIGSANPGTTAGGIQPGDDYTIGAMHNSGDKQIILNGVIRDTETNGSFTGGSVDTPYIGAVEDGGAIASDPWLGLIKAVVIYDKALTAAELLAVSNNMKLITAITNLEQYVFYLAQNPRTKTANNTSHELIAATEIGLYRTLDGGRSWEKLPVPDPSNAEFSDSPAAVVNELSFRWVDYDPLNDTTIHAEGYKASNNRVWLYKSTDNGQTWINRGVQVA